MSEDVAIALIILMAIAAALVLGVVFTSRESSKSKDDFDGWGSL